MIRDAYRDATELFVALVSRIRPEQWDQPGLDEWSVRDLVGHTARALLTVETYVASRAPRAEIARPRDYFLAPAILSALSDTTDIMKRGKSAGEALGADPARNVLDISARVRDLVRRTPDEAVLGTPAGGMRLIDYLPTRVFELAVHSLDIGVAVSVAVTLPGDVGAVALQVLADLAQIAGGTNTLLLAATGRIALPVGFSVL